jgi:hypothetical protein
VKYDYGNNEPEVKVHPYVSRDNGCWHFGIQMFREGKSVTWRPREWSFGVNFGPFAFGIAKGEVF